MRDQMSKIGGKSMKRLGSATLAAAALLLIATSDAHAYLDPGTGSMLLQGLVAGVAAASVVLGTYWHKVKAFFSRSHSTDSDPEGPADSTKR
jgi:hypothetical protein